MNNKELLESAINSLIQKKEKEIMFSVNHYLSGKIKDVHLLYFLEKLLNDEKEQILSEETKIDLNIYNENSNYCGAI